MRTTENLSVKTAVVVSTSALEECDRILIDVATRSKPSRGPFATKCSATLADGTRAVFSELSELLEYSNRYERRITTLTLVLEPSHVVSPHVEIEFGAGVYDHPFEVTLRGEEADNLRVRERFKDVAERVRAPYGWLYWRWGLFLLVAGIGSILGMTALALWYYLSGHWQPASPNKPESFPWPFVAGVLGAAVFGGLYLLRGWLYPRLVFEIGQEITRNEVRKGRRKWVVNALILGLLLSLFSKQIANWLGL